MRTRDDADTAQLSKIRIKERLRAALEQAAAKNKITMNAEIARRLERSFEPPLPDEDLRLMSIFNNIYKVEGIAGLMSYLLDIHGSPDEAEMQQRREQVRIALSRKARLAYVFEEDPTEQSRSGFVATDEPPGPEATFQFDKDDKLIAVNISDPASLRDGKEKGEG